MNLDRTSATRRLILQGAGSVALIGLGFGTVPALAAANDKYPEDAFKQKSDADAIKALYGKTAEASDKVKLDAPEIAENGAVVPIAVTTTLADVTSISFLVSENPNALAASYVIPAGTMPADRQPAEDGEDLQRDRDRGVRRQALFRDQGSQGHRRRLRRLEQTQGRTRWHRPFACAPPPTATPPRCRR